MSSPVVSSWAWFVPAFTFTVPVYTCIVLMFVNVKVTVFVGEIVVAPASGVMVAVRTTFCRCVAGFSDAITFMFTMFARIFVSTTEFALYCTLNLWPWMKATLAPNGSAKRPEIPPVAVRIVNESPSWMPGPKTPLSVALLSEAVPVTARRSLSTPGIGAPTDVCVRFTLNVVVEAQSRLPELSVPTPLPT